MTSEELHAQLDELLELAYKARAAEVASRQNIPYAIDVEGPKAALKTARASFIASILRESAPKAHDCPHTSPNLAGVSDNADAVREVYWCPDCGAITDPTQDARDDKTRIWLLPGGNDLSESVPKAVRFTLDELAAIGSNTEWATFLKQSSRGSIAQWNRAPEMPPAFPGIASRATFLRGLSETDEIPDPGCVIMRAMEYGYVDSLRVMIAIASGDAIDGFEGELVEASAGFMRDLLGEDS